MPPRKCARHLVYFFLFPYARIVVLIPVFIFPFFFELPAVTYLLFWIFESSPGGDSQVIVLDFNRHRGLYRRRATLT